MGAKTMDAGRWIQELPGIVWVSEVIHIYYATARCAGLEVGRLMYVGANVSLQTSEYLRIP
jgi:hypothetical protein